MLSQSKKEISYILERLNKSKDKKAGQKSSSRTEMTPPSKKKPQLSPEIAKLRGQIEDKLNPRIFTRETHFSKSDPGYGTPQEQSCATC